MQNDYLIPLVKKRKRVGRGIGSGQGKTCGRGQKGQRCRKSGHVRPGFEGGQTPIYRRFPKIGFVKRKKIKYQIINLAKLQEDKKVIDGTAIDLSSFSSPVKILGGGKLNKSIIIKAQKFSKQAQRKIIEANGNFELVTR
jgi:large subunit ribosomal protein L15